MVSSVLTRCGRKVGGECLSQVVGWIHRCAFLKPGRVVWDVEPGLSVSLI